MEGYTSIGRDSFIEKALLPRGVRPNEECLHFKLTYRRRT